MTHPERAQLPEISSCVRMRTSALLLLFLAGTCCSLALGREVRIPIQVSQDGTTVDFIADPAKDDLADAVIRFCARHLKLMDTAECSETLLTQVTTLEQARAEAQNNLPSVSFSVRTGGEKGEEVRFAHVRGSDPAQEAEQFCALHFSQAPSAACVNQMLENMQRALEETAPQQQGESRR